MPDLEKMEIAPMISQQVLDRIISQGPKNGQVMNVTSLQIGGNLTINTGEPAPKPEVRLPEGEDGREAVELMIRLLNLLPEPRLENLRLLALVTAREAFTTQAQTAAFLGVSPRAFTGMKQRKLLPAGLVID